MFDRYHIWRVVDFACMYWDKSTLSWKTDNMVTNVISNTSVECFTNHLTNFSLGAVQPKSDNGTSGASGGSVLNSDGGGGGVPIYAILVPAIVGGLLMVLVVVLIIVRWEFDDFCGNFWENFEKNLSVAGRGRMKSKLISNYNQRVLVKHV